MTIFICGGDKRLMYASDELCRLGYITRYLPLTEEDSVPRDMGGADVLLLPVPATKDGVHLNCAKSSPPTLSRLAAAGPARIFGGGFSAGFIAESRRSGRVVTDLLTNAAFTEQNAALTAEAALGVGMEAAGRSLQHLEIAVIGYGRIAARLTRYLLALGAHVTVYARREEARLAASLDGARVYPVTSLARTLPSARLIYNTVPAPLLTKETTAHLTDCAVVELASGRENISLPPREGVTLHFAHSLPGKVFPVSAGHIIAHTLDRVLQSGGRTS